MAYQRELLPDVLAPNLRVVFCGLMTPKSRPGQFYIDSKDRFWTTLGEVGLTPRRLMPFESRTLTHYGVGLTDLPKVEEDGEDVYDIEGLREKLRTFKPRIIAFNGPSVAKTVTGKDHTCGKVDQLFESTIVFVLPSSNGSAAAAKKWDIEPWRDLAKLVRSLGGG